MSAALRYLTAAAFGALLAAIVFRILTQ